MSGILRRIDGSLVGEAVEDTKGQGRVSEDLEEAHPLAWDWESRREGGVGTRSWVRDGSIERFSGKQRNTHVDSGSRHVAGRFCGATYIRLVRRSDG